MWETRFSAGSRHGASTGFRSVVVTLTSMTDWNTGDAHGLPTSHVKISDDAALDHILEDSQARARAEPLTAR